MPYKIQRRPTWIGSALTRLFGASGGSGDTSNPDVIPDIILPKIDVFGWEALERMTSAASTAAVGVESVFPAVDSNWVTSASGGVVPDDVALRIVTGLHIQHDDPAARIMWFGMLTRDIEPLGVGLPTDSGAATLIQTSTPQVCTRKFFLRPTENFVGRIRLLALTSFLSIRYTWIDLEEGEYLQSLP